MVFSIDKHEQRQRPALIDGVQGVSWTYGELADQVLRRSEWLRTSQKGLVFQFCRNDLTSVAWYLAAIEAGHAVALLSDQMDAALRAKLIALYRPEWVISLDGVDPEHFHAPDDYGLWRRRHPDDSPPYRDLALLLSTSGSTGSPKFVRLTRRNVEANANSIHQALGITDLDVPVAHLPINYSYGLSVLNSHLLAGASILLVRSGLVSPAFWEAVRRYSANSFAGVPYTYQMLRRLGLAELNAPSLRNMTQAGGRLDQGNIAYFHKQMTERKGGFWVMYGQTEATARMSILDSAEQPRKPGSAGCAIPGGSLRITTEDGAPTSDAATEGELVYTGPNVMLGYALGREDLSAGDERHGQLYTGDRARLDEEGYVYILGRSKRDAKVFGLRINLDELEALVKLHGPAAAVAGANRVMIYCEFGTAASHRQIRDTLSAKLKIHGSAFEFRRIDQIPTKESGKINYEDLLSRT